MSLQPQPDDVLHFEFCERLRPLDPSIKARVLVERAIIRQAASDILAAPDSFQIGVFDGEEMSVPPCRDLTKIMAGIGACDEEWIRVYRMVPGLLAGEVQRARVGTIMLVYGNDGWDVIADNSTNLEPLLVGASELAEQLGA